MAQSEVAGRLELAREIALQAGQLTLDYFQTDKFDVQHKQDGTPLTIADQQAEQLLRDRIGVCFPKDSIVGEEYGTTSGDSDFRWILDPIDGTKSFISGVPLYGTMVAVEHEGQPIIGSVYIPGLDEGIYASRGQGAWWFRGNQRPVQAQVSNKDHLEQSVLVTSEVETFSAQAVAEAYTRLVERVYFARTWGDVYGYLLVATGRVEIMMDPILSIWDAAAVLPILVEAGGKFTDWSGQERIDSGNAVGSNGRVHEQVLEVTRAFAEKPVG